MNAARVVVIGGSAGAITALTEILPVLSPDFPLPVVIAIHLHPLQDRFFLQHYNDRCRLTVKEAQDKEFIQPGFVYFAPPNYHLMIEDNLSFSLSIDAKVNFSRPSIDVLFESAVDAYGSAIIGIILTGANNDGARGLRLIKQKGGVAIVQDPKSADSPFMPQSVLDLTPVDYVLPLSGICDFLQSIGKNAQSVKLVNNTPGGKGLTIG